ncbi:MAG: PLP-dependent aminotransferase family protein [Candidatus Cloacimonetes bacterium]|nr:PLP-dependent aminotransferase family protein [Candidatus Cloacimonadota bacterium]
MKSLYTKQTITMKSSMIRELVEMTKGVPDLISFAGGFPSPKTFPKHELAELFYRIVLEEGDDVLQYGSSGGDKDIKEAIINFIDPNLKPEEVHICNGATNGIFYALQTFIEPGDCIITEVPSFLGSLVVFEALGAYIVPVSIDEEGIDTVELYSKITEQKKAGRKIKFIYSIPDFQNPSGITMSRKRRESLIQIAIENNIMILEDDPYSRLRFSGSPEENLFSIARNQFHNNSAVIYIGSFSKLLGPGLRIAYVVTNQEVIKFMNSWSQKVNVTTDRVVQKVVATYLNNNLLPAQIEKIVSIYKPLCDQMLQSLSHHMPASVKWTEPEGGMFVWLNLPEEYNSNDLFQKALEKKVAFIPGCKFFPQGSEKYNGLRLNFTYPTIDQIKQGVLRLSEVLSSKQA